MNPESQQTLDRRGFVRTAAGAQERQVDQFDADALILDRHSAAFAISISLPRGLFRIAERRWLDVFHGLDARL